MNDLVFWGVFALLIFVLFLLSIWQRKVAAVERDEAIADLYEARERGTDRALAQFPHINVQACIGCGSCVSACPEEGVLGLVGGVARVIHGSRCIGHALCEVACPIAAIKVGLGDGPTRPDVPELTEGLESSVPGVYIAGELGGLALIRIATEQGTQAIDAIAERLDPDGSLEELLDVLIIGAGPAGIAASLRAREKGLRYLTIDQEDIGGTVRKYPRRKLTLTGTLRFPLHGKVRRTEFLKEELVEFFEKLVKKHELEIRAGVKLQSLTGSQGAFMAQTSHGPIAARRILLALGRRGSPRKLGVPGEEQEKVLYQLIDAATYTDEHVLVVGGGDSAIETATALADQPGNVVTLSYRRDGFFRLKKRNEDRINKYAGKKIKVLFESEVQSIGPDHVTLQCKGEAGSETVELPNQYTFILAGGEPPYPLLKGMGVRFGGEDEPVPVEEQSEEVATLVP